MPARIRKFVFDNKDFDDDGEVVIEDESDDGITRRWIPIGVEYDPNFFSVWVWAYLIDQ